MLFVITKLFEYCLLCLCEFVSSNASNQVLYWDLEGWYARSKSDSLLKGIVHIIIAFWNEAYLETFMNIYVLTIFIEHQVPGFFYKQQVENNDF